MGKINILVVENQSTQFYKIKDNLCNKGYNVFPKESDADCNVTEFVNYVKVWVNEEYPDAYKKEAFEKICNQIEKNQIDLILMDYILGGGCKCKTGIALARAINSEREGVELPVLFMSRTEGSEKRRLVDYNRYMADFPQLSQWLHKGFFGDEILNEDYFSNVVIGAIDTLCKKGQTEKYKELLVQWVREDVTGDKESTQMYKKLYHSLDIYPVTLEFKKAFNEYKLNRCRDVSEENDCEKIQQLLELLGSSTSQPSLWQRIKSRLYGLMRRNNKK